MSPYDYHIDTARALVRTRRFGVVTARELFALYDDLRAHPDFSPHMDQLADDTGIERFEGSCESIRDLAQFRVFDRTSKRAIVVAMDVSYGLARMFQSHAEMDGQDVEVFRDIADAERWLGHREDA